MKKVPWFYKHHDVICNKYNSPESHYEFQNLEEVSVFPKMIMSIANDSLSNILQYMYMDSILKPKVQVWWEKYQKVRRSFLAPPRL